MPTLEKVIEELNFLSEVLSTRVRTLATGVLALAWVFVLGNAIKDEHAGFIADRDLVAPIVLAFLSLLADLSQYWCGLVGTRRHLQRMEKSDLTSADYDYDSVAYRLRTIFFYLKLSFMLASVAWLLFLLIEAIYF